MPSDVLVSTIVDIAELLPTPGDKSEGTLRSESIVLEKSECFVDSHKSSSVVVSSCLASSIPGIDVTTH